VTGNLLVNCQRHATTENNAFLVSSLSIFIKFLVVCPNPNIWFVVEQEPAPNIPAETRKNG
jgi:hypothetical protein